MDKKKYIQPAISCIELDNEISLALQSSPPEGPNEIGLGNSVDNPMKQNLT